MQVLSLANQKGGCGKTTTAIHLAAALHAAGERTLLVDLDPQAHATLGLGHFVGINPSLIDVLRGEVPARSALVTLRPGLTLLPATLALGEFEEEAIVSLNAERALSKALASLGEDFDYVVIDCPPRADGVLTANAVWAATQIMLVVETGAFALQGAVRAYSIFQSMLEAEARATPIQVLATMFDRRTRFARDVLVGMHARFGESMYDTAVRSSVRLREAVASGEPLQWSAPKERAVSDFTALAAEVRTACVSPPATRAFMGAVEL
jgi:chromosome partitioning protein